MIFFFLSERGRTVMVGVFEDGHGHHDSRRRRVEGAGGTRLLQRWDGAAVLRGNVGVRAGPHRTHHALQSLSCNKTFITIVDCYSEKKTMRSNVIQTIYMDYQVCFTTKISEHTYSFFVWIEHT